MRSMDEIMQDLMIITDEVINNARLMDSYGTRLKEQSEETMKSANKMRDINGEIQQYLDESKASNAESVAMYQKLSNELQQVKDDYSKKVKELEDKYHRELRSINQKYNENYDLFNLLGLGDPHKPATEKQHRAGEKKEDLVHTQYGDYTKSDWARIEKSLKDSADAAEHERKKREKQVKKYKKALKKQADEIDDLNCDVGDLVREVQSLRKKMGTDTATKKE